MKNKIISMVLVIVTVFSITIPVCATYVSSSNITSADTPVNSDDAKLKWSLKLGTGYYDAPSAVTIVDDTVLVMAQKTLYKLNKDNGKTIATAEMVAAPSYGTVSVTYANGVIYCPLGSGQIQAFDYKTMKSLWVYKDEIGGQSLTPIKYDNGFIYTGFWKNEDKYANYVCIDTKDENTKDTHESKNAKWVYKSLGGFYWAGCTIIDNYIVFGCDNGAEDYTSASYVLSLNKSTGKKIDSVRVTGDQRSSITQANGKLYFATKGGYLYSVKLSSNGTFDDSTLKSLNLGGSATASPVVYNNRLYIGVQGEAFGKGYIKVIDAEKLSVIYSANMKGYPQSSVLVSDAYLNDTGKVYIYSTYNAYPGGITILTDSSGQTNAVVEELFTPSNDMAEYSISTIVADEDGTLYYKNDSGNIFAIEKKENISWFQKIINAIREFFRSLFS